MYKIALLLAILASAQAQLISNGECDFSNIELDPEVIEKVNVSENYFEIKRISNVWNTGQCISVSLTVNIETQSAFIILKEVVSRKLIERNATFNPSEIKQAKYYNLVFKDFNSNFTVLGLEDKFVVLYACSNVGQQKQEYSWVFSPNTILTEKEKNSTENIIKKFSLNNATWVESSHTAEACENGGTTIKLSPTIVLILGLIISKV